MIKKKLLSIAIFGAVTCVLPAAHAATVGDYLIAAYELGTTSVDASSFELGRVSDNAASAPTASSPGVGPTISNTPTYDGNVAILNSTGEVKTSNLDIYADRGIDCAGTYNNCTDNGSNFSNSTYDEAGGAAQRAIGQNPDGVNQNQDVSGIINSINIFNTFISALTPGDITGTISTTSGDIESDKVVNLNAGLNILNFDVNSDITVKANLVFQGGADAFAIVFAPDDGAFKTSNGNLLIGDGGIGLNNVIIVSTSTENGFDLSNTDINGVSLWDLGALSNSSINMSLDNVSGCTQLVGGDVDIQNVRLSRCAFDTSVVPVPAAVWLFGSGLLGLVGVARSKART